MAFCDNCGKRSVISASFCHHCGGSLPPESTCRSCGSTLVPDGRFCHSCGTERNRPVGVHAEHPHLSATPVTSKPSKALPSVSASSTDYSRAARPEPPLHSAGCTVATCRATWVADKMRLVGWAFVWMMVSGCAGFFVWTEQRTIPLGIAILCFPVAFLFAAGSSIMQWWHQRASRHERSASTKSP